MPSFNSMTSYITRSLDVAWNSTVGQSIWQGLFVPLYSFFPVMKIFEKSDDVKRTLMLSLKQTTVMAVKATILYDLFYRTLYSEEDTSTLTSMVEGMLFVYCCDQSVRTGVQNFFNTSTLILSASKVRGSKPEFLESKESEPQHLRANIEGAVLYMIYSTYTDKFVNQVCVVLPGYAGLGCAFLVKSAASGWPVLEYLLSEKGMGPHDRYELLKKVWKYAWMLGASYTGTYWYFIHHFNKTIVSKNNIFVNAGVATLLFELYSIMALSREEAIPGQNTKGYDFLAVIKQAYKKPTFQYFLKWMLGEFYSLEDFVQSPAVSNAIFVRAVDLDIFLNSLKSTTKTIEDVRGMVEWVKRRSPFLIIPDKLIDFLKYLSADTLKNMVGEGEKLKNLAIKAHLKRYPYLTEPEYCLVSDSENNEGKSEEKSSPKLEAISQAVSEAKSELAFEDFEKVNDSEWEDELDSPENEAKLSPSSKAQELFEEITQQQLCGTPYASASNCKARLWSANKHSLAVMTVEQPSIEVASSTPF